MAKRTKAQIPHWVAWVAWAKPTVAHQIKKYGLPADKIIPARIGLPLKAFGSVSALALRLSRVCIAISIRNAPPARPMVKRAPIKLKANQKKCFTSSIPS